jgi:hypothetical protein
MVGGFQTHETNGRIEHKNIFNGKHMIIQHSFSQIRKTTQKTGRFFLALIRIGVHVTIIYPSSMIHKEIIRLELRLNALNRLNAGGSSPTFSRLVHIILQ